MDSFGYENDYHSSGRKKLCLVTHRPLFRTMVLGGEPARRRLGRATAAQRLGFRQYSREDSERARRARFESSRDHRARTDRSPVIGLSSTACRTLPEEQLLRPIAGERSVLVRWSREDSKRAR